MNVTNHRIEAFRASIIEAGIIDPEGTHQEFVNGGHGRKIDFDLIATGSALYDEWVGVAADHIRETYDSLPDAILGVANGTNRLAIHTAQELGHGILGLVSAKDPDNSKALFLPEDTIDIIKDEQAKFVLVLEDVGTTGSNSVQVARHALAAGAEDVEVLNTWQRRPQLELLEASGIPYGAIINEALTTYKDKEACEADGYCAQGWKFIPREK